MIRLVVVDDHTLFRRGLVSLLSDMKVFAIVGEASNGQEALEIIPGNKPDVILMDINMPKLDGVETLRALRKSGVDTPVLMLTISQQSEDLISAIQAGASGYVLKNAEPETLRQTIELVHAGEAVLAPEMTEKVFRLMRSGELGYSVPLSERELEVLRLLARGSTTSQAASVLFISENTVKTHVRHIFEKLDVGNRAEAVAKATQLGLL
jgi:DNA-binding NarL/FixJ family response regulator